MKYTFFPGLSISMLLVLLEPVYRADSKYVFAVWIWSQIREIYEKTLEISHISPRCFQFHKMALEWSFFWVFQYYWYCENQSIVQISNMHVLFGSEVKYGRYLPLISCRSGRFCRGFYLILFESKILCYFQFSPNSNAIWHGKWAK